MTLRVLALSTLPTLGAANRLRVEQYIPLLRDCGIEMEVAAFFDDRTYRVLYERGRTPEKALGVIRGMVRRLRDVARARRYDLLLVHRESMPLGPPVIEAFCDLIDRPYVFDFDDAIFLGATHPVNRAWAWLRHPSRVGRAVRGAAAVIASNAYLAGWARGHNENVYILPTPVDTDRHLPRPPHRGTLPTVIGWVGSSTTASFLHLLDEPLARSRFRRDLLVRVIGASYQHPVVRVEEEPWRLDQEPARIASFDVGVLPQPDDPWTRGKGAFKALLYMATAVPVVASAGGVNSEVIIDGETGYCVNGVDEWVEALDRLVADPTLRQRLGDAGRDRVESNYSLRLLAPRLAQVLVDAARRG